MLGKIVIELTRRGEMRETFSDLPDLGHDAYVFAKGIRAMPWTSKDGEKVLMSDYYEVTAVSTSSEERVTDEVR